MELIQIRKTRTVARESIGKFSEPSKMPCFAWSIVASKCITGSKLAKVKGSVCYNCYALKGFYAMPATIKAMLRRENKLTNREQWIADFVKALEGEKFFRWFDSGDLQSLEMLFDIVRIAKLTPSVKHWLPSKEYSIVRQYLKKYGLFPSNLSVRLSAHMVNSVNAPMYTDMVSFVFTKDKFDAIPENGPIAKCLAPSQGGNCRDCRVCWDANKKMVAYIEH